MISLDFGVRWWILLLLLFFTFLYYKKLYIVWWIFHSKIVISDEIPSPTIRHHWFHHRKLIPATNFYHVYLGSYYHAKISLETKFLNQCLDLVRWHRPLKNSIILKVSISDEVSHMTTFIWTHPNIHSILMTHGSWRYKSNQLLSVCVELPHLIPAKIMQKFLKNIYYSKYVNVILQKTTLK